MPVYIDIAEEVKRQVAAGKTNAEIAKITETSERTVRRAKQYLKENGEAAPKQSKPKTEPVAPAHKSTAPKDYHLVATGDLITVGDGTTTVSIRKGEPDFDKVRKVVFDGQGSHKSIETAISIISAPKKRFLKKTLGKLDIDSESGEVMYGGHRIPHGLESRIVQAAQTGDDSEFDKLVKFSKLLFKNPSRSVVTRLFDFIKHNDIEIDKDGNVIAYKRVKSNYRDYYSGEFDNTPGKTVSEPRWLVDEDNTVTCSKGLHVCSKSYLPSYHGGSGKIVRCRVSPENFVAIPYDYNNAKARTCEYYVIDDVTGKV